MVGAGPAGARAAELLARRGFDVLLIDPRAPWEKPCGGGLTAAALRNTPELHELDGEAEVIREVQAVAPSGASVVVPLREPYHVVSRRRLSRWGLERATSAAAEFLPVAARSVERDTGGWRIVDGAGDSHHARWLVAADGSASPLRRRLAPRLEPELAPLRVAYATDGAPPGRAVFRLLSGVDGYLWDFPRVGHHSVGVGVPPRTFGRSDLDAAVDLYRLAETGETGAIESGGAVLATALWSSGGFEDLGGRDFALLGDAAALADPATGEGIDYALRSAALAAGSFDSEVGFERYPRAVRDPLEAEIRRARRLREAAYRGRAIERFVRWAGRSRRGATVLAALADAVNEHRPLITAVIRGFLGRRVPAIRVVDVPCSGEPDAGREDTNSSARRSSCCDPGLGLAGDATPWRQRLEVPASWAGDPERGRAAREMITGIAGTTRIAENRVALAQILGAEGLGDALEDPAMERRTA